MANASVKEVEVPQPPVTEKRYVLELTEKEARAVSLLVGGVGGLYSKQCDLYDASASIHRALRAAGLPSVIGYRQYFESYPIKTTDKLL